MCCSFGRGCTEYLLCSSRYSSCKCIQIPRKRKNKKKATKTGRRGGKKGGVVVTHLFRKTYLPRCFLFVILGLEIKVEVATAKFRTRSETFAETQADVLEEAVNRVQALPTVAQFATPDTQSLLNQVLIIYFSFISF